MILKYNELINLVCGEKKVEYKDFVKVMESLSFICITYYTLIWECLYSMLYTLIIFEDKKT